MASGRRATDRRSRILFVDDEPLARAITAEGLEEAGFSLLTAESSATALALVEAREAVDLLVTDLSMPGIDGLALIREAQRRRPGLPAILLTGFATNAAELAVGGAVSGTFSLLRKPVATEVLAERIAVLLARSDTDA
jgi:CheY-like chemotaxis protein